MIDIEIHGTWVKSRINSNVLTLELFRDKNHKYSEGKVSIVVGVVELYNLGELIKKELKQ